MDKNKDVKSTTEKDSFFHERLFGEHHYLTKISDGDRRVEGVGNTPEKSQKVASEKWDREKEK